MEERAGESAAIVFRPACDTNASDAAMLVQACVAGTLHGPCWAAGSGREPCKRLPAVARLCFVTEVKMMTIRRTLKTAHQ
jgi:hypothetical protein